MDGRCGRFIHRLLPVLPNVGSDPLIAPRPTTQMDLCRRQLHNKTHVRETHCTTWSKTSAVDYSPSIYYYLILPFNLSLGGVIVNEHI